LTPKQFRWKNPEKRMKFLIGGLISLALIGKAEAAIWEFDLGGLGGSGLLGANEVDNLPNSFASGKEIGHNEIPGILYDDEQKVLEFHVGWGSHEVVQGANLTGQYLTSGLFGPATMSQNAPQALYTFDTSNGYVVTSNDPTGRTGFIHARVQLVDMGTYTVAAQEADLLGSRFYFNIMSTAFESGEIRGQLLSVIPEPAEYASVAAGALLVTGMLHRRWKLKKGVSN
jgi:hypothetical protein